MCKSCSLPRRRFLGVLGASLLLPILQACARKLPAPIEPAPTQALPKQSAGWWRVNWEAEKIERRIPTDTAILHHTGEVKPGITWEELSKLQRERLYAGRFSASGKDLDPDVRGQEPYSGHFRLDKNGILVPVFYAYHFLIRPDGAVERLLVDTEVGWHAGNWGENMRSVAIAIDGDFTKGEPTLEAQKAVAQILAQYAKEIPLSRFKPHFAFRSTICPGPWFNTPGSDGRTGRQRILDFANLSLGE